MSADDGSDPAGSGDDRTEAASKTEHWEDRWLPAVPVADSDTWPEYDLEFAIEDDADGGARCTIFPREDQEYEFLTAWITAESGAYVSIEEVR